MTAAARELEVLSRWCERHLGAAVERVLFRAGYFSDVVGTALVDGRGAVVKVRADALRLTACSEVHAALHTAGVPSAEPLTPVMAYDDGRVASAEALLVPEGGRGSAEASAALLAGLVRRAPPVAADRLAPSPAWVLWHHDNPGVWPTPDDREVDLNARAIGWMDELASSARHVLALRQEAPVVGHVDWVPQNVWWKRDGEPLAVHDWDSLTCLPEPAVAGVAAAVYRDDTGVEESAEFLEHYEAIVGPWTDAERRTAWAAGLWVRLFDAKKDVLAGRDSAFTAEQAERRGRRAFR